MARSDHTDTPLLRRDGSVALVAPWDAGHHRVTVGALTIDGYADQYQLYVEAHSTQTSNVLQVNTAGAAAELLGVSPKGRLTVPYASIGTSTTDPTINTVILGLITHTGSPLPALTGMNFTANLNANQTGNWTVSGAITVAGGASVVAAGRTGALTGGFFTATTAALQTSATATIPIWGGNFNASPGSQKHTGGNFRLISGHFGKPAAPQNAPTSSIELGIFSAGPVQVGTGENLYLNGSASALGDCFLVCDGSTIETYIDDTKELSLTAGEFTVVNTLLCTGDQVFSGTGTGLPFAEIYAVAAADTIAIGGIGKANKVQITTFDTNGQSNNMTPDHTNDHITVVKAGMYLCTVSLHIETVAAGGADTFGFSVYKTNGGTEFVNVHAHQRLLGGGGDVASVPLSGIIDLAANDTIELWVWNMDSDDDIKIQDVTMSLVQVGGT